MYLKDGTETWILAHLEVQNQREKEFAKRIHVYKYRIFDLYQKPIISIAILGDTDPHWRPSIYREEIFGCVTEVRFHVLKLIDYRSQRETLETSTNPFSVVILAHLAALDRYPTDQEKLHQKIGLTRLLYERGFQKQQILDLYLFIDYMLTLPEPLAIVYNDEIHRIEEEKNMAYITTAERIGMQKGLEQGLQQGMQQGIQQGMQQGMQQGLRQGARQLGHMFFLRLVKRKFSTIPNKYLSKIDEADEESLLAWGERTLDATSLEDIFKE